MITDPVAFIDACAQRGVEFRVGPAGQLRVRAPRPWLQALGPQLALRKTELVAVLDALDRAAEHRIAARAKRSTVRGAE